MANIPQPPLDLSNESLHRTLTDAITFMRERHEQGIKYQSFTQDEINGFTDLSYEGTIVYNSTTRESNVAYVSAGNLLWRAF